MFQWREVSAGGGNFVRRFTGSTILVIVVLAGPLRAEPPHPVAPGEAPDFGNPTAAQDTTAPVPGALSAVERREFEARLENEVGGVMATKSFLAQGTAGVDPFVSNDASAVIGRPSMSQMFDTAVDFNNEEATFGLKVAPALLVTPFPDWYVTGLSLLGGANTEQKSFSFGGKWDLNLRDPRLAYRLYPEDVAAAEAQYEALADEHCGRRNPDTSTEGRMNFLDCLKTKAMVPTMDDYRKKLKERIANPFALSIGGNAAYDNVGEFGGANATLALNVTHHLMSGFNFILTANGKYEDALPSDTEFDELKKQTMMSDLNNDERSQKIGGGGEMALKHGIGGEDGNERSLELGVGAAALACLGGACDKLSDGSSVKINPFIAFALTKTLGGRVDVFWDGTGNELGDAIAGVSFKYAFRGLDAPLSAVGGGGETLSAPEE